ncbi:Cloroperoxidase [Rickenella mellea]|uniref:Cloroperoxidase n=1 Tax=Rickenella mellea TaxID=50990 RepID=A0A4Y7PV48_9AGAM|nr:Cloroperoxidase [Rickenella mellea]
MTDQIHVYVSPSADDSRSPCPALNTLANHGYLLSAPTSFITSACSLVSVDRPRNGREITPKAVVHALQEAYQLSTPLAYFLSYVGFGLLGQFREVSLTDIGRHNMVEHDASISHVNAFGKEYAPTLVNFTLFDEFVHDSKTGLFITAEDIATSRVRRELDSDSMIDAVHQEIARGEAALVLSIFGDDGFRVPLEDIVSFWRDEQLPDGWKPSRTTTLRGTVGLSTDIRKAMKKLRATKSLKTSLPSNTAQHNPLVVQEAS